MSNVGLIKMRFQLIFAMLLLLQACASSRPFPVDSVIPPVLEKKLHDLAGSLAKNCGFAMGEENLSSGSACMQSAHAQGSPFTFVWGPATGLHGIWFAWAGTEDGKVFQVLLANESANSKDILAAERLNARRLRSLKKKACTVLLVVKSSATKLPSRPLTRAA